MKTSTSNGKRIRHSKTAKDAEFRGCALSIDHATLPVGLEFGTPGTFAGGEAVLVCMTIEEAERVHKALGDMIALRKRQAEQDADRKRRMDEARALVGVR